MDVSSFGPQTLNALENPEQVPLVARQYLGENPRVKRIHLYEWGFSMEVRDPKRPENLDDYRYMRGEWTSEPVSVSVSDIETLDQTTFTLGAVNWKAVPRLMQQALDGVDLEDESISAVSYDRLAGNPPRVYMGVTGARGTGRLIANADGTHVEVARN